MGVNKYSIVFLWLIAANFIYAQKIYVNEQEVEKKYDEIFGEYRYLHDSISASNPQFFESIELKKDASFTYKNRIGGFIRTNIEGRWELKNELLILNSFNVQKTLFSKIDCSLDSIHTCSIDVKDFDGYSFNYSIKIGNQWIKDLYGTTILKKNEEFDSIQIVSSSGLYSDKIRLDPTYNCYKIRMARKRQFISESWIWFNSKVRPRRPDGQLANYCLFKMKN